MIKVSVLFPKQEGGHFDMGYYCTQHVPMLQKMLGDACKCVTVEQGLGGATPGSQPSYVAMGHLYFDSVEAFQTAFEPHATSIFGDLPNYTSVPPTIQISEVKI